MKRSTASLLAFTMSLVGCHGSSSLSGVPGDTRVDSPLDTHLEPGPPDVPDVPPVDILDTGEEEPPPEFCTNPPPEGPVGEPCITAMDCEYGHDLECFPEHLDIYEGETYITHLGGYCHRAGILDEACRPRDPDTCPEGSLCFRMGYDPMDRPVHACMDECSPASEAGIPHDDNCGCRDGYRCWIGESICVPGCSNDRQCCEIWSDTNEDGRRDFGEVSLVEWCRSTCDNVPDEWGRASYRCINPGTPGARFGDACDHHSRCPADSFCLTLVDPVEYTVEYPGGYCYKERCDLVGRGCGALGACVIHTNVRGEEDFDCVRPCHTGSGPGDPGFGCRTSPSDEREACIPVEGFLGGPPSGQDGMCWMGNYNDVAVENLGDVCELDEDCYSPIGLGLCWNLGMVETCAIRCSRHLEEDLAICGPAGTAACLDMVCLAACDNPHGSLGSNGCPYSHLACYDSDELAGEITVPSGTPIPAGLCLPACTSHDWCRAVLGAGLSCHSSTGICSY